MKRYQLEITATAEKQLKKLARADQVRVTRAVLGLATNPFPVHCRRLTGTRDVWRIRVGRYRVIYSVEEERVLIIILKIGHRRDVYR